MKKLLIVLVALLLPQMACADGPAGFPSALCEADDAAFATLCEAALADMSLAGSTVAVRENGEIALARNEFEAFVVMYRPDGLMMLCHFIPEADRVVLDWHNDLLLSHDQDIALSLEGAAWSGGSIPCLELGFDTLRLTLKRSDGTQLSLKCEGFMHYEAWRVTEMALYVSAGGGNDYAALILPEDCLADDIYLATCEPGNWRRGEQEEGYDGW